MLPADAQWPTDEKAYVVGRVDGELCAFCVVGMTDLGVLVNELWCLPTPAGYRALIALAEWIEARTQAIATDLNKPLRCGGMVTLDNPRHIEALKRRGYVEDGTWDIAGAVVLAKTFYPQRDPVSMEALV